MAGESSKGLGVAAVGILVVLGALFLVLSGDSSEGTGGGVAPVSPDAGDPEPEERPELVQPESDRASVPAGTDAVEPLPEPAPTPAEVLPDPTDPTATITLAGQVVDPRCEPVADLLVVDGDGLELGRSGPDGRFAFEAAAATRRLLARGGGWTTVRAAAVSPTNHALAQLVVVAPSIVIGGQVVDDAGAPVGGARVQLSDPTSLWVGFPRPLDATVRQAPKGLESDSDGTFEVADVPVIEGSQLYASAEGYLDGKVEVPATDRMDLRIVLAREDPSARRVSGFVLLADGTPAEGATVYFGDVTAEADPRGAFEFVPPEWTPSELPLAAALDGYRGALVEDFGAIVQETQGRPAPQTLRLGVETLAIAGRVLDENGEGAAGWRIRVKDPTAISRQRMPVIDLESLAFRDDRRGYRRLTGDDGGFRLEGLFDRDYTLVAWHDDTLQMVESDPIPAGTTGVELRLPPDAWRSPVNGTVVGRDGTPLEHAGVSIALFTERTETGHTWSTGELSLTNASGEFSFERVPSRFVHLYVTGENVIPYRHEPEDGEPLTGLVLNVARRCHFRVDASDLGGEPHSFRMLDGLGDELMITRFEGGSSSSSSTQRLVDGKSVVLSVSEDAHSIVLSGEVGELFRGEVSLDPDVVNVLVP